MKYLWKIALSAAVFGMSGALLLNENTDLKVIDSAWAQSGQAPASEKSSPPDTTHYIRPMTLEDLAPRGKSALGAKTQKVDANAVNLLGSEPGIFIVDVVVNNTNPNLQNTDTAGDGETSIAINPEDPNEIVISAFSGGFNPLAPIYHSTDGGLTWTREVQVPKAPGWRGGCPCDWTWDWGRTDELSGTILDQSDLGDDDDGDTFDGNIVSLTTTDPTNNLAYMYLGNPAEETNINVPSSYGNSDQPWLLVNPDPSSPAQDNVYVAYDDFSGAPDMRVAVSANANPPDFTGDVKVGEGGGGGTNPGLRLAKDPRTGIMWAVWSKYFADGDDESKDMDYMLNRSTDGGATWPLGGGSGTLAAIGDSTQATPKFGTVNALLGGVHHATVDPTTGDLYYVFGNRDSGTNKDRLSIRKISSDGGGGLVFGDVHFVTGQVEAAIPQVAVLDNGTVGVFYYTFDGFSSDDFPIFSSHLALSGDEGASFDTYKLVTFLSAAKDSCPNDQPDEECERQRVLGDYMGMKAVGNCFYGSFTANGVPFGRTSANHDPIFFKTCVGPQIQVASDVSFGDVCESDSVHETLEVCNTGTNQLVVESITTTDTQFSVATPSGGYPVSISPDFCFPFDAEFTPDEDGAASADAVIVSNDQNSPTTVELTGNVSTAQINTFIANSGSFGEVCSGLISDLNLTIQNDGACGLQIDSVSLSGADTGDFELPDGSLAGTIIEAGNSLLVPVRFAPADFNPLGTRTASVDVASSTQNGDSLTTDHTPVSGMAPPPDINVAIADAGDFGKVCKDDYKDLDLTLFNQGRCDLSITDINSFNFDVLLPDDLQISDSEPLVLSHDAEFTLPLRYAPDVCDDAPFNSSIQIISDSPGESPLSIPISGSSPCPNLVIDQGALTGAYAFPATVVDDTGTLGCYSERNTNLRNTGACPLTITDISAAGADFTVMDPTVFPIVLPAGEETLGVTVRFTPQDDGMYLTADEITGVLTVVSDDPDASDDGDDMAELCGEGVIQSGIRVLVTDITSGDPVIVDSVDSMTVRSKGKGKPGPVNLQFSDVVPVSTSICDNAVNYHLNLEALAAVASTGKNGKSQYEANAKEGNLQDNRSFALDQCEFSEFQMQLQSSDGGDGGICLRKPKGASCSAANECCSDKCTGKSGAKTCK